MKQNATHNGAKKEAKVISAGICAFIVGIGSARFAFTALLPEMLVDFLSVESAGILSFANYFGYFIGSVCGFFVISPKIRIPLFRIALILCILTIFPLATNSNLHIWFLARLFAGIGSALIMTVGSSIIFDLIEYNKKFLGLHFCGVGISIIITAFIGDIALKWTDWYTAWIIIIIFSIPLSIYSSLILTKKNIYFAKAIKKYKSLPKFSVVKILIIAYFLEGMGFVVQASFLPDIVNRVPGLSGLGGHVWYLVGVFAVFGPYLWTAWAHRYGYLQMMIVALLIQALGLVIPVFSRNIILNLLSGAIYGNTMMGLTALFMNYGAILSPKSSTLTLSTLTTAYAIGTIISPLYCAKLFNIYKVYDHALILTAFFVVVASLLLTYAIISINNNDSYSIKK